MSTTYLKKTFRDDVRSLLVDSDAAQLLELCTTPSEPKAVWKAVGAPAKAKAA